MSFYSRWNRTIQSDIATPLCSLVCMSAVQFGEQSFQHPILLETSSTSKILFFFSLRSLHRASLIWIITTVHQLGGLPYPTHVSWFRFVHLVNLDLFPHKIDRKSTPLSRLWEIHKLTLTPVNVVLGNWKSILNSAQGKKHIQKKLEKMS